MPVAAAADPPWAASLAAFASPVADFAAQMSWRGACVSPYRANVITHLAGDAKMPGIILRQQA